MIYTTGTIAIAGNTLTGTGTNFTAAGSLIRVGCTLVTLANPVQVFQITAINSATQLTVTPAANPAIAAGTAYAILLSDSLSVDGLAQNIAETLTLYQRNMSGFADVMNGAGDVTITTNGVPVTVPGQKSLAKKGANSDITSLSGLTTALSLSQGGTGATTRDAALSNLGITYVGSGTNASVIKIGNIYQMDFLISGGAPVGAYNPSVVGGLTYYTHYYKLALPMALPNGIMVALANIIGDRFGNQNPGYNADVKTCRDNDNGTGLLTTYLTVSVKAVQTGWIPYFNVRVVGY